MKSNSGKNVKSNEALSLLSILSLVLAFIVICLACLFVLFKLGAFELPWFISNDGGKPPVTPHGGDTLENLFDEKSIDRNYTAVTADENTLEMLIMSLPADDSYFLRCSVMYVSDETSLTEIYNVWRFGDKYKIVACDETLAVKTTTVCDGITVTVTDDRDVRTSYPVSEYFPFSRISPLPDFSFIGEEGCAVIYTNDDGREYEVICEFTPASSVSDIKISMSTGMIASVKTYCESKPTLLFEMLLFDGGIADDLF